MFTERYFEEICPWVVLSERKGLKILIWLWALRLRAFSVTRAAIGNQPPFFGRSKDPATDGVRKRSSTEGAHGRSFLVSPCSLLCHDVLSSVECLVWSYVLFSLPPLPPLSTPVVHEHRRIGLAEAIVHTPADERAPVETGWRGLKALLIDSVRRTTSARHQGSWTNECSNACSDGKRGPCCDF
jgi:hypothetical protein